MLKKSFVLFFVCCLLSASFNPCLALGNKAVEETPDSRYIFQGHAEINNEKHPKNDFFTGDVEKIENGATIKMTVSNVLSAGYTEANDEFFAEITTDLEGPRGVVIPAGSIAHGKVNALAESKRMGRDGYINLQFDYIVTPDGREIPIEASMTTKRNKATSIAKVVAEDTAYTVGGGVVGGLVALRLLGLGSAVASHGMTVAGGAGAGAVVGLGLGVARKGKEVLIAPGDEIKVKLNGALELPVFKEAALKEKEEQLDGFNVKITNCKLENDPFGEPNTITLSLSINNQTDRTFSSFDIALMNDYKSVYYPSPFGNTEMWFSQIKPYDRITGKLSFAVDNPKRKHWLVFYDSRTRKPVAKISVDNAIKEIKKETKNKKK